MKQLTTIIALTLVMGASFYSCKNDNSEMGDSLAGLSPEERKIAEENMKLKSESDLKDSAIYGFMSAMNEIEENLSLIKQKEQIITINNKTEELRKSRQDQIVEDIQLINSLLENNKNKVASLSKKLKKANLKMAEFEKIIERLTKEIESKDGEIASLKAELTKVNASLENLLNEYNDRVDEVSTQKEQLNTGFYAFGTKKELMENGVLSREGGFIGIGKSQRLKEDFNREYFTKVDISSMEKIDLGAKKAKILTSHPSGSYKFMGEDKVESISILNPGEFWSASKYLVIVIDN